MLRRTSLFLAVGAMCIMSAASMAVAADCETLKTEMVYAQSHDPPSVDLTAAAIVKKDTDAISLPARHDAVGANQTGHDAATVMALASNPLLSRSEVRGDQCAIAGELLA